MWILGKKKLRITDRVATWKDTQALLGAMSISTCLKSE